MVQVKSHPLVVFWVLAYACSWAMWPLYLAGWSPSPIIGFGPALAAAIVLAVTEGRPGLRGLLAKSTKWRVPPVWYAVALGGPLVVSSVAALLTVAAGAPAPTREALANWPSIFVVFVLFIVVPGIGGT